MTRGLRTPIKPGILERIETIIKNMVMNITIMVLGITGIADMPKITELAKMEKLLPIITTETALELTIIGKLPIMAWEDMGDFLLTTTTCQMGRTTAIVMEIPTMVMHANQRNKIPPRVQAATEKAKKIYMTMLLRLIGTMDLTRVTQTQLILDKKIEGAEDDDTAVGTGGSPAVLHHLHHHPLPALQGLLTIEDDGEQGGMIIVKYPIVYLLCQTFGLLKRWCSRTTSEFVQFSA